MSRAEPGRGGPAPRPDDILYLMDTTGRPEGAVHTLATTIAAADEAMDARPGDRYLNVMPLFHVASRAHLGHLADRVGEHGDRRCRLGAEGIEE